MEAYGLERSGRWVEVKEMPSLPDGGATLLLFDRSGHTLDQVNYHPEMHAPGLHSSQGVALERVEESWHSAASVAGYMTPGEANSQSIAVPATAGVLNLEPAVFHPGTDGYRDVQGIVLAGLDRGSLLQLWITDMEGRRLRTLANNHLSGEAAVYCWDGCDDSGQTLPRGFYVVHLEVVDPAGGRHRYRKVSGLLER
jgi:hypothetical protein